MTFDSKDAAIAGALPQRAARRRSLLWRVHFWAALIATPFAILPVLTGLLYAFTPQIEQHLYGHLEHVTPAASRLPLDFAVRAASAAAPAGTTVQSVLAPYAAEDAVKVTFGPQAAAAGEHAGHEATAGAAVKVAFAPPAVDGHAAREAPPARPPAQGVTVFVDPYNGKVLGTLREQDRFSTWAKSLHSRLLQGEGARWMIELAASWLLVMLLSGVVLWLPTAALPRRGESGRAAWRQWHSFAGVVLAVLTLTMVATGITWSKYAGERVRWMRDVANQAPPKPPHHLHSMPVPGIAQLGWQAAWDHARALAPDVAMQLTPPRGPHGIWLASAADRARPASRFDLALNSYDGSKLYYSGWDQQTAFGQATALGIPFHRGEFGWWNQVLLILFGSGVLFSMVSGWVMIFKRVRGGRVVLPKLLPGAWRSVSPVAVIVALAMFALMPLLALSGLAVLLVEAALAYHAPRTTSA